MKVRLLTSAILAIQIVLSAFHAPVTCSELPPFSLGGGISYALIAPGTMDDFWNPGINFGVGAKLPLSFSRDHNQFWINLAYHYFPFDQNAVFPIKTIPDSLEIKMNGKDAHLVTAEIFCKLTFVDKSKKIVPYFTIGSGFIGRSKTKFSSDSVILPHSETGYKGAGLFTFGLGTDIQFTQDILLFLSWNCIVGNTKPGKTSIAPLRIGILTKFPAL
jgi:hypothetical protein